MGMTKRCHTRIDASGKRIDLVICDELVENLNPGLAPETVKAVSAAIDWSGAPVWAEAYIAAAVDCSDVPSVDESGNPLPRVEYRGCWVLTDGKRLWAPAFGAELLQPGAACIVRRGSTWDGIACLLLRTYCQHEDRLNLLWNTLIDEPSGSGLRLGPWGLTRTPIFRGIALALGYTRERSRHSAFDPGVRIGVAG